METFDFTKRKIAAERQARIRRLALNAAAGLIGACIGYAWPGGGNDLLTAVRAGVLAGVAVLVAGILTA